MRLRRLDLTRYGKFTDQALDFGPAVPGSPDLHIVYGLNEAGKSTAFSAYLDLLFGVPDRSPYNFLHAYNAMQIGGVLEFDGSSHELVRLKQRTNALLDTRGQPVNEALLSTALGGMSRGAYRTMFSLDEHSLRDGGEAIVESKGDLGELLFSASAGLADVSAVLSAASEEAQRFHKKRARSTQLAELKQQLAALKSERDAIDTFASSYAALVAGQAHAEEAYRAALAESAAAKARFAELDTRLRALPLLKDHDRLLNDLSAYGDLARPPREWAALLAELMRDETRLHTQMAGLTDIAERLEADIAAISVDDQFISATADIDALDDGRARYRTAENDLPKRRMALAEQDVMLVQVLKSLGQDGHPDPASLLVPAALTARLRDLIEARSGILARMQTAEREHERAQQAVASMPDQETAEDDTPISAAALRRLDHLLSRLQKGERQAQLAIEARAVAQHKELLAKALESLRPWRGDAEALEGLHLPDTRQMERWRGQADDLYRRIARHEDRRRDIAERLNAIEAQLAALQSQGDLADDATASEAVLARDAAWQAHLAALDQDSAHAFEERMRVVDRIGDSRLSRSSEVAEIRQLQKDRHIQRAALDHEKVQGREAQAAFTELSAVVGTASPLTPGGTADLHQTLADLDTWMARRRQALVLLDSLRERQQQHGDIADTLDADRQELDAALEDLGWQGGAGLSLTRMIDGASDRLSRARDMATLAETRQGRLADLQRDLAQRERDLAGAQNDDRRWREDWTGVLAKTWFEEEQEPSPVRALLDALSELPSILRERDQLAQRIALMQRDMERFADDVERIAQALGMRDAGSPLDLADQLMRRRSRAERDQAQRAAKQAELTTAYEQIEALKRQIAGHESRRQEMTAFFGTETLAEVSLAMEQAAERDRLERRIAEVSDQVLAMLQADNLDLAKSRVSALDQDEAAREAAELASRIDNLDQHSRQLFADLARARDRVAAVGGDDAVARIEARRTTVLMEIEDLAVRHLKLRAGTLAAEQALSIYREKHRSSMMRRASEAFNQMTRGDYAGLAAQPDRDKEILIGVTRDGASKLSDAMSTGTRYQLYLALRLAGYEEFTAVRPSVPFVADDIMETFDELRSEEVFKLFGQMARLGQVIYLTHHRHLCDIARTVVPDVRIHQI